MTEPTRSNSPEGHAALDQVLELAIARLLDRAEGVDVPTFDAVLDGVIEDLTRNPLQLRTLLGAAVAVTCALATSLAEQVPEDVEPDDAIRAVVGALKQL